MRPDAFRHYLLHVHKGKDGRTLSERTIDSRVANCSTVEAHEGNLDGLFDLDRMEGLLSRLEYTRGDQDARKLPKHKIPIDGDWHNGSATYKAAVKLYRAFCEYRADPQPPQQPTTVQPRPKPPPPPKKPTAWPQWSQPDAAEALMLAKIVARYARFLRPEIVRAIAEDNEANRASWSEALEKRGIDPCAYLWPGSTCAFPGVRRYAGSSEIAIFRKRATGSVTGALALDDNDYPKQVWSFMLTGKKFPKHGPEGYALAHLADHKAHKNRAKEDFDPVEGQDESMLDGLYTAPTNTVYLPVATIKPTDFGPFLRNLLKRRAAALYGTFSAPLPPWLSIRAAPDGDWDLDRFAWPDPVGDPDWIPAFLKFRRDRLEQLLRGAAFSSRCT